MQSDYMLAITRLVASLTLLGCALPATAVPAPVPAPKAKAALAAPQSTSQTPVRSRTCPAKELQYLVGQSRTVLQTMRFGSEVRFEERGRPYPADFYPLRTRIIIGPRGNIEKIVCG